jgi:hypothetical protein
VFREGGARDGRLVTPVAAETTMQPAPATPVTKPRRRYSDGCPVHYREAYLIWAGEATVVKLDRMRGPWVAYHTPHLLIQ